MSADTTIIIPTWNSLAYLPRCLEALHAHSPEAPIIVVDNASSDGTSAWLTEHAPHVTLLANSTNEGFGAACNRGVEAATTPWVCLLNADAFVTNGWLDALHRALATIPGTAIAVPMFLNEDGTLQEAGGILPRTGEGVMYGSGDNPREWRFRFPRIVDYGSAACWLIARKTFVDLDGFDVDAYGLAYYEDSDFCLRAAAAGLLTVYVPDGQIVHVRNASGTSAFITDLLARNQRTFMDRWDHLLAHRPVVQDLSLNPHRLISARDVNQVERVLVVVRDLAALTEIAAETLKYAIDVPPDTRITIVADSPPSDADAAPWLARGVEIGSGHDDWYGWIRDRIAYFTIVVTIGEDVLDHFGALIEWTQTAASLLMVPHERLAERWRPFHRSVHAYRIAEPYDRERWETISQDRFFAEILGRPALS